MGSGGVQLRSGVDPDLTTFGKYLAGGMTFGAFGGRADLMAAFDPHRGGELTHGGTFDNNVVTMAGGVAALSELLTADVLDALFERGEHLRAKVASILERCTLPLSVTGMGSMFTIHAVAGPVRSPADLAGTTSCSGAAVPPPRRTWHLPPPTASWRCHWPSPTPTANSSSMRWPTRSPRSKPTCDLRRARPDELIAELELGRASTWALICARLIVLVCRTTWSPSPSSNEHNRHAAASGSSEWNTPTRRRRR